MVDAIQVRSVPASIRRKYNDQKCFDLSTQQMAKEVQKQYQRNSEDVQLLKFPSTKNILWDHSEQGDPYTLHISYFRKPRLCITEKILKFAQRHLESLNQKSCGCVLVGSLIIDEDGQGVTFDVERLDPVADPNSSTSHAAGDMLIPFTVQNGIKDRSSNSDDYNNALQLLKDRCCSKDPIELGNFLLTKGWCSFYSSGDKIVYHLEFDVVTMGSEIKAVPVGPVPIVPTALSNNLSGPMSISHMQGIPKTGYLTMDHTRKLLLVLESDPKVVNLPLVGIWISGVSQVYSPYVWSCCLRYIHNAAIQDRVCSPPDPFLLVLYNPTHSKPEFYECSTSTGSSKMTFDIYSGYEAVQLSKTSSSSYPTTEIDLDLLQSGSKYDTFERAADLFSSKMPSSEKRRVSSPAVVNEDITPRLIPAPHKAKMPIMQSMVPEVSLFFGNEDTTFVPAVNHPKGGHAGLKPSPPKSDVSDIPRRSSSGQQQPSSQQGFIQSSRSANHEINALKNSYNVSNNKNYNNNNGDGNIPSVSVPNNTPPSGMSSDTRQVRTSVPSPPTQPHVPQSYPHQPGYHHALSVNSAPSSVGYQQFHSGPPVSGIRPGFCSCPSCPKPAQFYNGFDPARPLGVPPHPMYANHGPHPPRINGPPNGYHMGSYPGMMGAHPGGYGPPHRPSYPGDIRQPYTPQLSSQSQPYGQPHYASNNTPVVSSSKQGHQAQPITANVPPPQREHDLAPVPQASNGFPSRVGQKAQQSATRSEEHSSERGQQRPQPGNARSEEYAGDRGQQRVQSATTRSEEYAGDRGQQRVQSATTRSEEYAGNRTGQSPSNPGSDNSGRSSDDSGLSFTPEKQNSPANPSPKTTQTGSSTDPQSGVLASNVKWENVPPEIYQLLLQQDSQLKQLQAQIEMLKSQQAKSLDNTINSQQHEQTEKCNMGTNTSINFTEKVDQVSACMQTSLNSVSSSNQLGSSGSGSRLGSSNNTGSSQGIRDNSHSSSGVSANESRTPYEYRHRGRVQMNSTQREEADLDMSQGELVALMNNMHDKTIDSVQSEMIVDLPSFQSSPTRSPRSQESYCDSTAFNLSPRSPISASMCEQERPDSEAEEESEGEEDVDNTAETDNPEYYNKLMDNIKKMLSQNTTDSSVGMVTDGYQGDVSSDPSTPAKMEREEINLGAHLQSFLRFDQTAKGSTDTTFIPKINYVSMFLDSDTDTSMEINAMAMKYLKDEQLTQLTQLQAKNRLKQGTKQSALLQKILQAEDDSTPNVTTMGISPNDLTFNTKKYMEKHGLLDGTGSGGSGMSTPTSDSYRLKTNYSTVSTGSEDGTLQALEETFSTPTLQRNRHVIDKYTPSSEEATPTQSPYNPNDSRTPRPSHVNSRLTDHRRLTTNGVHDISRDSYGQGISPQTQTIKQQLHEKHNYGANARYASPQVTPAPGQPRHSPPERETDKRPIRYASESRRENDGFINTGQKGVRNQYQQNDVNTEDGRILDITRLKQLPKLL